LYVSLFGHTTFVQPTLALTVIIIDKITIVPVTQSKGDLPSNYW